MSTFEQRVPVSQDMDANRCPRDGRPIDRVASQHQVVQRLCRDLGGIQSSAKLRVVGEILGLASESGFDRRATNRVELTMESIARSFPVWRDSSERIVDRLFGGRGASVGSDLVPQARDTLSELSSPSRPAAANAWSCWTSVAISPGDIGRVRRASTSTFDVKAAPPVHAAARVGNVSATPLMSGATGSSMEQMSCKVANGSRFADPTGSVLLTMKPV